MNVTFWRGEVYMTGPATAIDMSPVQTANLRRRLGMHFNLSGMHTLSDYTVHQTRSKSIQLAAVTYLFKLYRSLCDVAGATVWLLAATVTHLTACSRTL